MEQDDIDYEKLYERLETENINLRLFILKIKNSSETLGERIGNALAEIGLDRMIYITGLLFSFFIVPLIGLIIESRRKDRI